MSEIVRIFALSRVTPCQTSRGVEAAYLFADPFVCRLGLNLAKDDFPANYQPDVLGAKKRRRYHSKAASSSRSNWNGELLEADSHVDGVVAYTPPCQKSGLRYLKAVWQSGFAHSALMTSRVPAKAVEVCLTAEKPAGPLETLTRIYTVAASKFLVVAANALVLLLASRSLRPDAFGSFSGALGASVLLGRLLLFGCEFGYTRLRTAQQPDLDSSRLAGAAVAVVVAGSFLLILVAALAGAFGGFDASIPAIALASAGWACTELAYWVFLVHSEPLRALLAQAGTVTGRAAAVAVAAFASAESDSLLFAYGVSGCALGLLSLGRAALRHARPGSWSVARKLLQYSAWQGVAQVVATLAIWFGAFALLGAGKPVASGQFSLAMTMTAGVLSLCYGLTEYLTIRAAELPGPDSLSVFLRSAFMQSCRVASGCVALLAALGILASSGGSHNAANLNANVLHAMLLFLPATLCV